MPIVTLRLKKIVLFIFGFFILLTVVLCFVFRPKQGDNTPKTPDVTEQKQITPKVADEQKDFIKWVEFDVTSKAMEETLQADVKGMEEGIEADWIKLLACLGAKYGGDFDRYKTADLNAITERLKNGEEMWQITENMKYYDYYYKAYYAVLNQFVGPYTKQVKDENGDIVWKSKYGLRAYSPIAEGYSYNHYDDFGSSRSYGFARRHLGHDMMGSIGTPIVAIEGGYVETMGWNQYGGWRIGIRSFDKKRYYYYAHLRKDHPYQSTLKEGDTVKAGEVIGYLGMTGYSHKENVNNINVPHLHLGIQLIFDESQKESNNEIWIDCYNIVKFLQQNRSTVAKNSNGEYERVYDIEVSEE